MSMTELETTQRRLERRLAEVCGHLNVLNAELVSLTAESIEAGAWAGHGIQSPQHWVAWQTGVSPERAAQIVHMAQRCTELPVTFTAFADGLLSIDQVATVTRRTPAHNDAEACELARSGTVAQLRVGLSKHFFPPPPKPDKPAAKPEQQHRLSAGFNDDGDFAIHGLANPADGAVIDRALREARDFLFNNGHSDVTWLDALVEISKRSLGAVTSPTRRDNYKIVVHLDSEGAWIHHGPTLPASLLERVCCDGQVQPLWHKDGAPVNMGRSRHIVPSRTRIVVEDRDRICRHPTCHTSIGLEVHHVIHWLNGGRTDTVNLCCLCSRHHHAHHRGEFSVDGDADQHNGLTFRNRHGRIIDPCGQPTPPGTRSPPDPAKPYIHPTGERLQAKWLSFTPPPPPNSLAPDN